MASATTRTFRFLALGDSYTIGEAVSADERWPVLLATRLRQSGIDVDDPLIVAQTGWTTDELDAGIDAAKPRDTFDLVTLLIGVNNQYRGRSVDEYGLQFGGLLRRAIEFAGSRASRVIVVSIPDWGPTPFARESGRDPARIGVEIDAFNTVAEEAADRAGVQFVDITPGSKRAANDETLIASDGLHPSRAMYEEWAEALFPVAFRALTS